MSGIMTLSSKLPDWPPKVTATSLPIIWAQSWRSDSGITGFTFPGMILLPGWTGGRMIFAKPAAWATRKPADIVRHFGQGDRDRLERPAQLDAGILARLGLEMIFRFPEGYPQLFRQAFRNKLSKLGIGVDTGSHRGPANGELTNRCHGTVQPFNRLLDLILVARKLLPERDGGRILEMRPTRLYDRTKLSLFSPASPFIFL